MSIVFLKKYIKNKKSSGISAAKREGSTYGIVYKYIIPHMGDSMQTKYKIDRDTRTLLLKYIRKYDEYKKWYQCERAAIMYPSRTPGDGMPRGGYMGDPTLTAAEKLERLDEENKTRIIRAIDHARNTMFTDVANESQRERLMNAIWLSCINPWEYPFEIFAGAISCERRQFYRYKNEFLNRIKRELNM